MSEKQQPPVDASIWGDALAAHPELFKPNDVFTKIAVAVAHQRKKPGSERVRENLRILQRAFTEDQWRAASLSVEVLTRRPLETWLEQWETPPHLKNSD
jgi:hypothetical protein